MAWGEEEREYSIINSQKLNLTAYHVKMYLEEIQVLSFRLSDFTGWQLGCYIRVYRRCLNFSKKLTHSQWRALVAQWSGPVQAWTPGAGPETSAPGSLFAQSYWEHG